MIEKALPRSLGAQLLLMLLLALGAAQGLGYLVFSEERDRAVRAALGFEAAGRAANVALLLDDAPDDARRGIVSAASSPLVRFWTDPSPAVDHDTHANRILAKRLRHLLDDPAREVRIEAHQQGARPSDRRPPMQMMHNMMHADAAELTELVISIKLRSGDWLNVRTMYHRPVGQWITTDFAAALLAAVLISAVALFTTIRIVRPMRALAKAAEHAGRGEAIAELTESGPLEIRETVRAFNNMQARLTRFVADRIQMLAALSHDLRSPLTAMRLRVEMIEQGEDSERLTALVEEMQSMVESTLAFAKGEAETENSRVVDLSAIMDEIVADLSGAENIEARVSISGSEEVITRGRPVALKRALRNLVDNAIRYGGVARIVVSQNDGHAMVSISDEGPGIPKDRQEEVFEPFRRLEDSRSRETGGAGLGLAIARTTLRSHGGDVKLSNLRGGGLEAVACLPLLKNERTDETG